MSLALQIKTVKELTDEIKNTLEQAFPYVWVRGELGSVKLHSSGHKYFSLKEDDYVINGICWRGTPLSTDLEEGKIVECYAKVTIFGGRSSYQIIAKEIREVSSKGNILLKLEELKKKLVAEGIFQLKNKESLIKFPKKIAILTSPTGAVFHDMMHRINDRFPCLYVYFYPINVQGADSKKSILAGLAKAEEKEDVDIVILSRGGGSLEDLWIFNDEEIVRKVANLKKSIITAIGHETDTTLVDYASNLRAPTPTAAIELSVPDKFELNKEILKNFSSSFDFSYEKLLNMNKFLDQFNDYDILFSNSIENFYQKLDNISFSFISNIKDKIKELEINLAEFDSNLILYQIEKAKQEIQNLEKHSFEIVKIRLNQINEKLEQEDEFIKEKNEELKEKVIILSKNNNKIVTAEEIKKLNKDSFSLNFFDGTVIVSEN
ncbi:exodeoxyribonuclease VII large subunit [Alphaproteobacteria bacterium endosymbiont of Tiliacea citrago]|uniref:exodeoxyribonuclease VII large subunit n=1 Tax=Alphaproteobacteria bacterium endosymbiont of Tiliacea citrago TaxID=3077944 RepID=UPI00313CED33